MSGCWRRTPRKLVSPVAGARIHLTPPRAHPAPPRSPSVAPPRLLPAGSTAGGGPTTRGGSDTSLENNNVYGLEPKVYVEGSPAAPGEAGCSTRGAGSETAVKQWADVQALAQVQDRFGQGSPACVNECLALSARGWGWQMSLCGRLWGPTHPTHRHFPCAQLQRPTTAATAWRRPPPLPSPLWLWCRCWLRAAPLRFICSAEFEASKLAMGC